MGASVKIMLSYDWCHFEVCKSTDENVSDKGINQMRKDVQKLADEAVRQYKKAKEMAAERIDGLNQIENFEAKCKKIEAKSESDRTLSEIAMLKQYHDENWREQFEYRYDYEDDSEDYL
jgi:hypothetical protein